MSMELIFKVASMILAVFALVLVYRVVKGPNIIDRVLAADGIDILLGIVMVIFGAVENRSLYLDLGLITTLLGFIGTVLIAKFLKGEL